MSLSTHLLLRQVGKEPVHVIVTIDELELFVCLLLVASFTFGTLSSTFVGTRTREMTYVIGDTCRYWSHSLFAAPAQSAPRSKAPAEKKPAPIGAVDDEIDLNPYPLAQRVEPSASFTSVANSSQRRLLYDHVVLIAPTAGLPVYSELTDDLEDYENAEAIEAFAKVSQVV